MATRGMLCGKVPLGDAYTHVMRNMPACRPFFAKKNVHVALFMKFHWHVGYGVFVVVRIQGPFFLYIIFCFDFSDGDGGGTSYQQQ